MPLQPAPPIKPYVPASSGDPAIYSDYQIPNDLEPGLNEAALTRLMGFENLDISENVESDNDESDNLNKNEIHIHKNILNQKLEIQVIFDIIQT